MKNLVKRICKQCKKDFAVIPAEIKRGHGVFCSKKCAHESSKQYHEFECKYCKKLYKLYSAQLNYKGTSQKFCSLECKRTYHQNNKRVCNVCGATIKLFPSQLASGKGVFCSRACHDEGQRKRIKHVCKYCGVEYETNYKSRKSKFCSQECVLKYYNSTEDGLRKRYKGLCKKPTRPERILLKLIEDNNLPFRYVGDGAVIISNLNPDFIHSNGERKIIEVFGDYWHRDDVADWNRTEKGRKEIFEREGYKILIIWESDIKNALKGVLNLIKAL